MKASFTLRDGWRSVQLNHVRSVRPDGDGWVVRKDDGRIEYYPPSWKFDGTYDDVDPDHRLQNLPERLLEELHAEQTGIHVNVENHNEQ